MTNLKAKIFYVEDDETLSFITREGLQKGGFEVEHYSNGQDAIDAFADSNADVCLIDIMLPKLDGFSLVEQIRKLNKEIPILFITAKSLLEDKIHGLKLGADDYITKPYSMDELI